MPLAVGPHLWRSNLPDEEEDHMFLAPLLEHIAEWGKKHLAREAG